MSDTWYELRSGRKIGVSGFGDPKSTRLVLLCLPPAASGAFNPDPVVTDRYDVHVIVVDRPGYGGSEPLGDDDTPSVERAADDIAEYLSGVHLVSAASQPSAVGAVGVVGWGGGGATALALASANPLLVDRLVLVGAPKPSRSRRGEPAPSSAEFARPRFISSVSVAAASLPIEDMSDLALLGAREDDPALAEFGVRNRVARLVDRDSSSRSLGVAWDRLAARDTRWTGGLNNVRADALLVYGDSDPITSAADGNWYRRNVPRARLEVAHSFGRLAIVSAWERVLQYLGALRSDLD